HSVAVSIHGLFSLTRFFFFFSSRRRHTRFSRDWSSDVCSSDLNPAPVDFVIVIDQPFGGPGRSAGFAARADLIVFALAPADQESGGLWLRDRLAPEERARSTTMVVDMMPDGANGDVSPARLAAIPQGRRRAGSARG